MSLLMNIAATYRGPRRVMRGLLSQGAREDRALALAMGSCVAIFVVQWPRLAREAWLTGQDLQILLGGALMGLVFILPLLLYGLAGLSHLVMRVPGGRGSGFGARLALFWALAAAMPVLVLHGLVGGFMGSGAAKSLVGLIWLIVFAWFWLAGLYEAEFGDTSGETA